jgi:competence protein ComEC
MIYKNDGSTATRVGLVVRRLWPLALIMAGAARLAAQEPTPLVVRRSVRSCLSVRPRADANAPAFTCLAPGTPVTAVAAAPYWRQVRLADGRTGWLAKKYLEPAVAVSADTTTAAREDAWLEVHVVDVGQGDGIWIHTFDDNVPGNGRYEGKNIVIDGGPNAGDTKNELLQYILAEAHEGAVIDALIITHPHDDHYPGAIGILRHFDVREFYDSGYPSTKRSWLDFLSLVRSERANSQPIVEHIGRAQLGTPNWGSELQARFLYAWPGSNDGLGKGNTLENNASIVLRLQYGSQSILFMGDAEGKERNGDPDTPRYVEKLLLDTLGAGALRSTVLKIAHHGSETSSSRPFIEAVDPQYVVVSSGRRPYGGRFLPDASTLKRYCDHNPATRVYRTDQDDESEGRTGANDGDGDHIVIRTNGLLTQITALSAGREVTQTACPY